MHDVVVLLLFINTSFALITKSDVVIMFSDIDKSFLSKVFKVPGFKAPAAPLESVASPDAPVAQIFKSPIAGRRRSKFSNASQKRVLKKRKLRLSNKQRVTASLEPKVQYNSDDDKPRSSKTYF